MEKNLKGFWGLNYELELQPEIYGEALSSFKQGNNIVIFKS